MTMYTLNKLTQAAGLALAELEGKPEQQREDVIALLDQALRDSRNIVSAGIWVEDDVISQWEMIHEEDPQPPLTKAEIKYVGQSMDDQCLNDFETVWYVMDEAFRTIKEDRKVAV